MHILVHRIAYVDENRENNVIPIVHKAYYINFSFYNFLIK